jgi:group I intron endonuclease
MQNAIIYMLTNKINGKRYIGFTTDLQKRLASHKYRAEKESHNYILINAINKHGWDNFECSVLEEHPDAEYAKRVLEPKYIKEMNTFFENKKGYNMTHGGEGTLGYKKTPEECEVMSKRLKGRTLSPERIEQIRQQVTGTGNPNYGKTHSEETRNKISEGIRKAHKEGRGKRRWTEEQRKQASENKKGWKPTKEMKRKMSEAQIGKPGHAHTEEHKAYMSKIMKDREFSQDTLDKLAVYHAYFVWKISGPDNSIYETCSLKKFSKHFKFNLKTVIATIKPNYKPKRKRTSPWTAISKTKITPEEKEKFLTIPLNPWIKIQ